MIKINHNKLQQLYKDKFLLRVLSSRNYKLVKAKTCNNCSFCKTKTVYVNEQINKYMDDGCSNHFPTTQKDGKQCPVGVCMPVRCTSLESFEHYAPIVATWVRKHLWVENDN